MPRANRHFVPGHIWHITHRCHQRKFLLKFAHDRRRYLHWVFEAKKRLGLSENLVGVYRVWLFGIFSSAPSQSFSTVWFICCFSPGSSLIRSQVSAELKTLSEESHEVLNSYKAIVSSNVRTLLA
jgi:hypothetical protein